jgi:AcrR family transcriptional regulator
MAIKAQRGERRSTALSKERIVHAAIEILDAEGETALTFRALAARLETGAGAIYWHVADKDALLAAATNAVIARATAHVGIRGKPRQVIRSIALSVFDTIDAHPWIGSQLARTPWESAMLHICEGIGRQLLALGVPDRMLFDSWSALVSYILGVAGQNAANARIANPHIDRQDLFSAVIARWAEFASDENAFIHKVAKQLRNHDDRAQFLAGIDFILAGITSKCE